MNNYKLIFSLLVLMVPFFFACQADMEEDPLKINRIDFSELEAGNKVTLSFAEEPNGEANEYLVGNIETAEIVYTLDGTNPDPDLLEPQTLPLPLTIDKNTTVKAIAIQNKAPRYIAGKEAFTVKEVYHLEYKFYELFASSVSFKDSSNSTLAEEYEITGDTLVEATIIVEPATDKLDKLYLSVPTQGEALDITSAKNFTIKLEDGAGENVGKKVFSISDSSANVSFVFEPGESIGDSVDIVTVSAYTTKENWSDGKASNLKFVYITPSP